jgi:hypothetical protein
MPAFLVGLFLSWPLHALWPGLPESVSVLPVLLLVPCLWYAIGAWLGAPPAAIGGTCSCAVWEFVVTTIGGGTSAAIGADGLLHQNKTTRNRANPAPPLITHLPGSGNSVFSKSVPLKNTAKNPWSRHQIVCGCWDHLVGSTVELFQSFVLHLQFHLRILFEDLRVGLAKHLSHPLVGYSSGAQPCGIRGAEVVNPKIGNLCSSKSFSPNSFERGLVHDFQCPSSTKRR